MPQSVHDSMQRSEGKGDSAADPTSPIGPDTGARFTFAARGMAKRGCRSPVVAGPSQMMSLGSKLVVCPLGWPPVAGNRDLAVEGGLVPGLEG
jgi:hypothetical protein